MARRAKTFEFGTQLAWLIDSAQTYRSSPIADWKFIHFNGVITRRRRFSSLVLLPHGNLPEVTIEPVSADLVRVASTSTFSLLPYGDKLPIYVTKPVDVPYGSVIRLGELLLVPLYEEQAESVRSGLMVLPKITATEVIRHGSDSIATDSLWLSAGSPDEND